MKQSIKARSSCVCFDSKRGNHCALHYSEVGLLEKDWTQKPEGIPWFTVSSADLTISAIKEALLTLITATPLPGNLTRVYCHYNSSSLVSLNHISNFQKLEEKAKLKKEVAGGHGIFGILAMCLIMMKCVFYSETETCDYSPKEEGIHFFSAPI